MSADTPTDCMSWRKRVPAPGNNGDRRAANAASVLAAEVDNPAILAIAS